jgi:pilus assembly protein Flp/PilA
LIVPSNDVSTTFLTKETKLMAKFISRVKKFFRKSEEGATAVEYGIMVSAIAAVIIVTVYAIGTKVEKAFTTVLNALP